MAQTQGAPPPPPRLLCFLVSCLSSSEPWTGATSGVRRVDLPPRAASTLLSPCHAGSHGSLLLFSERPRSYQASSHRPLCRALPVPSRAFLLSLTLRLCAELTFVGGERLESDPVLWGLPTSLHH